MKQLIFALLLVLTVLLAVQSAPLDDIRPRRDLKELERIMKEMVESHGIIHRASRSRQSWVFNSYTEVEAFAPKRTGFIMMKFAKTEQKESPIKCRAGRNFLEELHEYKFQLQSGISAKEKKIGHKIESSI
ncbi:hypothetical protein RB195_015150 [Necator americanus]|uniref:Uncharacterized protein n=1 Tax=Necator americanus TaxID=51031 RepID=A0ABR1E3E3_NECAM